jgi:hypothetical protein
VLQFLTSAIFFFSGAAGLLVLLDWLLLKKQKEWINDKPASVWVWLSYQQSLPYVRWLKNPRVGH